MKATKSGSTATALGNSVLIISHITFRGCRVHIFPDNLSRNSCIIITRKSRSIDKIEAAHLCQLINAILSDKIYLN